MYYIHIYIYIFPRSISVDMILCLYLQDLHPWKVAEVVDKAKLYQTTIYWEKVLDSQMIGMCPSNLIYNI